MPFYEYDYLSSNEIKLYKISDNVYNLVKSEFGTHGEYFDYIICLDYRTDEIKYDILFDGRKNAQEQESLRKKLYHVMTEVLKKYEKGSSIEIKEISCDIIAGIKE